MTSQFFSKSLFRCKVAVLKPQNWKPGGKIFMLTLGVKKILDPETYPAKKREILQSLLE